MEREEKDTQLGPWGRSVVSKEHVICCRVAVQDSTKHWHDRSPGEAESVVAKHPGTSDPQREESPQEGRGGGYPVLDWGRKRFIWGPGWEGWYVTLWSLKAERSPFWKLWESATSDRIDCIYCCYLARWPFALWAFLYGYRAMSMDTEKGNLVMKVWEAVSGIYSTRSHLIW